MAPPWSRRSDSGPSRRAPGRAVVLITLLLAGSGAVVLPSLPSDIYPPLQFPRLLVIAHSGSLPAQAMMTSVTRPLEQAAMEVPGIRRVRSRTFRGATEISAQLEPGTDMALALQELQSRVAEVRQDLPADAQLVVERLTVSAFPMISLNLTGGLPTPDLNDYAFYVVRPAMARVPGVGRVEVAASDTREIEVAADPDRLLAAALTVDDVVTALRASNRLAPVGRYAAGGREHLVLASGLWGSADEIARTPVAARNGATVRVADVAAVFPGAPDRTALVTGNGRDAAVVSVSQQPGASILDVKAGIEDTLHELTRTLPSGLRLSKVYDLAEFVATAIANVRDAILIGGALAVLVLLLFLRDWRVTLIASITLPLTVLSTFLFMKLFGESINLMSMGGLQAEVEGVQGVVDVVGPQQGAPETTWRVDPGAAGRAGLTIEQVQTQLAEAWLGETATDLQLGDRSIPVRVRYRDQDRFDPDRLARLILKTPDGRLVPLSSVARAEVATGDGELTRENLRQVALVTGRLEGATWGARRATSRDACASSSCRWAIRRKPGGNTRRSARPSASCYWSSAPPRRWCCSSW